MRKYIALLLAVLCLLSISACKKDEPEDTEPVYSDFGPVLSVQPSPVKPYKPLVEAGVRDILRFSEEEEIETVVTAIMNAIPSYFTPENYEMEIVSLSVAVPTAGDTPFELSGDEGRIHRYRKGFSVAGYYVDVIFAFTDLTYVANPETQQPQQPEEPQAPVASICMRDTGGRVSAVEALTLTAVVGGYQVGEDGMLTYDGDTLIWAPNLFNDWHDMYDTEDAMYFGFTWAGTISGDNVFSENGYFLWEIPVNATGVD